MKATHTASLVSICQSKLKLLSGNHSLTPFRIHKPVFLKESLKCTNIYIVGVVRGFLSTKKDFMLKISVKRHVLSVLYSI